MGRFAEFFAGIGLVREAIEPLGWDCVFANDISPDKAQMYGERFGTDHLRVGDINHLKLDDLPQDLDLLTASFPCIDLSLAGNRRGLSGQHSGAIWPFLRLTGELARERMLPKALLLENVTGFVTSNGGRDLEEVCTSIGDLGYVLDLVVVDAKWFTPQSRPRLFVVALREDLVPLRLPPTNEVTRLRNPAIRRFQASHRSIPFAEFSLPEPPRGTTKRLIDVLEDVPANDDTWWSQEQVNTLVEAMHERHASRVEELVAGQRDGVATMYRRVRNSRTVGELRNDRIAGCLRTANGGSSVQFLVDGRNGTARIRPLNGREYARLQGADHFPISVGRRQAQIAFGDAVCVPAVRWLVDRAFGFIVDEFPPTAQVQTRFADDRLVAAPVGG